MSADKAKLSINVDASEFNAGIVQAIASTAALRPSSALEERRQRAREAYQDAVSSPGLATDVDHVDVLAEALDEALDEAIETATRVRMTPEIVGAAASSANELLFFRPADEPMPTPDERWQMHLKAAFTAAGFEVEP
jgi:hypothetical protein